MKIYLGSNPNFPDRQFIHPIDSGKELFYFEMNNLFEDQRLFPSTLVTIAAYMKRRNITVYELINGLKYDKATQQTIQTKKISRDKVLKFKKSLKETLESIVI